LAVAALPAVLQGIFVQFEYVCSSALLMAAECVAAAGVLSALEASRDALAKRVEGLVRCKNEVGHIPAFLKTTTVGTRLVGAWFLLWLKSVLVLGCSFLSWQECCE
jgi:hypothetical protein